MTIFVLRFTAVIAYLLNKKNSVKTIKRLLRNSIYVDHEKFSSASRSCIQKKSRLLFREFFKIIV